ncbi:TniB family NTP-binding protein [Grimontia sp. SpTr1]|uniref:TniB family NTP-binding protein n=1 Tax=Grimontia sp. SpTr1 TaxID=2995319 RepID=UPI00248BB9BC|nr:TniB family NTP-binding protein [Grimontia sp. SpTr1]
MNSLKAFRSCFIEYPAISEIFGVFDRLRLNRHLGGEQESMLLTGETGSGKTALVNQYLAKNPTNSTKSLADQKILSTRIPSNISEEGTIQQFLTDLNNKASSSRTNNRKKAPALAKGIVRQLKDKNVELIIVNEIQELIEFSTADMRQEIANTFKYISEEAKVPFVLVGMPYAAVLANEAQWSSRLGWKREIDYFRLFKHQDIEDRESPYIPDVEGKEHFAKFVAGLASRMQLDQKPMLTGDNILLPLFSVCSGECRKLKHFLEDALLNSFIQEKPTLDKEVLSDTFVQKFPKLPNPFKCSTEQIEIRELKAVSRYNLSATSKEEKLLPRLFTDQLPMNLLLNNKPLRRS